MSGGISTLHLEVHKQFLPYRTLLELILNRPVYLAKFLKTVCYDPLDLSYSYSLCD